MFSLGLSVPIMPLYATTFTPVLLLIGLVVSSYWIVRVAFEIPFGTISDYFGRKNPIVIGLLLDVVGAGLCAITNNILLLVVGQTIRGVGGAAFFCVGSAAITEIMPARSRGKAMGLFQAIEFIGFSLGISFGGVTADLLGYQRVFWVCTLIAISAFAASSRLPSLNEKRSAGGFLLQVKQSFKQIRVLGTFNMVIICLVVLSVTINNIGLMGTIMPLYTKFLLGLSLTQISVVMASRSVGTAIGSFSGGWISDRTGQFKVLFVGIFFITLSVFCIPLTNQFIVLVFLMGMNGVAFGFVYCTVPVLVTGMFSSLKGLSIGIYRTFFDLGGIVGPFLLTTIVSLSDYVFAFYTMTGLLGMTLLFSFLLMNSEKELT